MKKIIINEEQLNRLINQNEEELTYYKFFNKVKRFICDLLNDPINADVDNIFKHLGINKGKMVEKLINRNIIIRKEKIKELSNSNGNKEAKMIISYDVPKKNFRRKMKRLFSEITAQPKIMTEEGECGVISGNMTGGVANGATSSFNNATYDTPFGKIQRRKIKTYDDSK